MPKKQHLIAEIYCAVCEGVSEACEHETMYKTIVYNELEQLDDTEGIDEETEY